MARSDPEKLAQALRVNLRRRKTAAGPRAPVETEKAPESAPEKPPASQG
jgi:hypothetical protein